MMVQFLGENGRMLTRLPYTLWSRIFKQCSEYKHCNIDVGETDGDLKVHINPPPCKFAIPPQADKPLVNILLGNNCNLFSLSQLRL